jgi:RNA polymerase sigma factor (sigma-70 family)
LSGTDNQRFVAGLAAQYGRRLKQFLRLRLGNRSDVPDLAQEVFLRLLRVPNHEQIRSPEAYLFTIASHVVHQHHQKQSSAPASLEWVETFAEARLASTEDVAAKTETAQRLEQLERTLDELPPRVAKALLLHRLAGHTIGEIAGQLGVAEITVKKYLAKALVHCRATAPEGQGGAR